MKISNTPYDDVFRTLLNDCSSLILPMINEIFQESYTGAEEIIFGTNEHFLNQQDGVEEERITDSSFVVKGKAGTKKYHWECQSVPDSSMLIRFFEYDSQIALDEGDIRDGVLHVSFPHSAVLFLRYNEATPDNMQICITTPGGTLSYGIPVMKSQQYTLNDIFEKDLLFLIPFYIFSHESRFERYEKDEEELETLRGEYAEIRRRLDERCRQGRIDEYTKCTILDMSKRVLEHIAVQYERVKEGVKSVMGGRILEHEAKTILNQGKMELIGVMLKKGCSYEDISQLTDISIETLKKAVKNQDKEAH